LGRRSQSNRLRVGYLHLKKAIDEVVGMVSMLDDDGNPAGVDAVLGATIEYRMQRIKDVRQRLNITVAIMPPKFVRQIEQGCPRALKAQVRSERMEQWKTSSMNLRSRSRHSRPSASAFRAACCRRGERSRSTRSNRARNGLQNPS
jgi:hypothetical protein